MIAPNWSFQEISYPFWAAGMSWLSAVVHREHRLPWRLPELVPELWRSSIWMSWAEWERQA